VTPIPAPSREGRTTGGGAWRIRATRADDAAGIVAVRDRVAAEGDTIAALPGERGVAEESLLLAGILGEGGLSLTLEVDGAVAGHLVCQRRSGNAEAHVAELALVVDAPHRSQGLGAELIAAAIAWARTAGVAKLVLSVLPDNARALAAYRRAGFVEEGRLAGQVRIGGVDRDLLLMGLQLR
jgi:ribosomal protein S18 acetylase RimI-like enzyme